MNYVIQDAFSRDLFRKEKQEQAANEINSLLERLRAVANLIAEEEMRHEEKMGILEDMRNEILTGIGDCPAGYVYW